MSQNPGVGANSSSIQPVSTKTALTASAPTNATVTGTSAQIVASNSSRKGLTLTNLSTDKIFLGYGSNAAVLNSGDSLLFTGSTYNADEYSYVTSAVNAISSGTSSLISIQEYV